MRTPKMTRVVEKMKNRNDRNKIIMGRKLFKRISRHLAAIVSGGLEKESQIKTNLTTSINLYQKLFNQVTLAPQGTEITLENAKFLSELKEGISEDEVRELLDSRKRGSRVKRNTQVSYAVELGGGLVKKSRKKIARKAEVVDDMPMPKSGPSAGKTPEQTTQMGAWYGGREPGRGSGSSSRSRLSSMPSFDSRSSLSSSLMPGSGIGNGFGSSLSSSLSSMPGMFVNTGTGTGTGTDFGRTTNTDTGKTSPATPQYSPQGSYPPEYSWHFNPKSGGQ